MTPEGLESVAHQLFSLYEQRVSVRGHQIDDKREARKLADAYESFLRKSSLIYSLREHLYSPREQVELAYCACVLVQRAAVFSGRTKDNSAFIFAVQLISALHYMFSAEMICGAACAMYTLRTEAGNESYELEYNAVEAVCRKYQMF